MGVEVTAPHAADYADMSSPVDGIAVSAAADNNSGISDATIRIKQMRQIDVETFEVWSLCVFLDCLVCWLIGSILLCFKGLAGPCSGQDEGRVHSQGTNVEAFVRGGEVRHFFSTTGVSGRDA